METPCLTGGWIQEAYIERQYADNLVSETKGGKIVPWLATSWKTSPDHLTWTFTLKPGVKFTNGEPLDAKAVVDNFYAWLNPETINPTVADLHRRILQVGQGHQRHDLPAERCRNRTRRSCR